MPLCIAKFVIFLPANLTRIYYEENLITFHCDYFDHDGHRRAPKVYIGSHVTPLKSYGSVTIQNGTTNINAGMVVIQNDTTVEIGSQLFINQ